ncbi:hypothetical protein [Halobaculum sp. D14]|uniref:hypothetical protein n=1 Tax=Halobaculum sp. D14 TaxID=3421642 RepID=UPI003EB6BA44
MSELTRRRFLGASGALAAGAEVEWDELGFHPDESYDWDDLDGIVERRLVETEDSLSATTEGKWGGFSFEEGELEDESVSVSYVDSGLLLVFNANGEDSRLGASAKLDAQEAREIALGLWMGAEEYEAFNDA